MDDLMQKAIKQSAYQKKPSDHVPWKTNELWPQAYHSWDAETEIWQSSTTPPASSPANDHAQSPGITAIALYSWNIEFMLPCVVARMDAALTYLKGLTSQLPPATAAIINIQEATPSDLITISQTPWIRARFYMSDQDSFAWGFGMYWTTTLVDRRLKIACCFRVHYAETRMERDALFVDVTAPAIAPKMVRFGNSHLESLALDPPRRRAQMRVAAQHMHLNDEFAGAVIAGDFNAIQPFDATLHADNDLQDAYLESGGSRRTRRRGSASASRAWTRRFSAGVASNLTQVLSKQVAS